MPSAPYKKQLIVVVSTPAGVILKNWVNISFEGFTKELNAGVGEAVIKIPVPFDYSGADLSVGNDIEMRVSDLDTLNISTQDTANSRIIYRGYISLIERDINGPNEEVTVHILGYYTRLSLDVLKNSTQTTLYSNNTSGLTTASVSQNAADIGKMMQGVIDRYIAETVNPKISYDATNIPLTSTVATYTFEQKTYREAMDILKRFAPAGTYYYINEQGSVIFKATPTTPTHKFVFGRHFSKIHVENNIETVRNFALVWNGDLAGTPLYYHYQDDDSLSLYGRRTERVNDYGIENVNASNLLGTKFLAENKSPQVKVVVTITDNNEAVDKGYDIESIQPGDTCTFSGFATGLSEIFKDNMIITSVNYTLNTAEITVELIKSSLVELQTKQDTAIKDIGNGGLSIAATYS